MKKCPKCGFENNDDTKFCINCGRDLTQETRILKDGERTEVITNGETQTVEVNIGKTETNISDIFKSSGICPNCFSLIDDENLKVCPSCGFKLKEEPQEKVSYPSKKNSKIILLFVSIVLIIFLGISIFIFYSLIYPKFKTNKKEKKENKTTQKSIKADGKLKKLIKDGSYYEKIKDIDQAIICWEKVLKKDPENSEAFNHLTKLYFQKGDYDKSYTYSEKTLEITNGDPEIFFIKAKIEMKRHNFEKAERDLNAALSLSPNNEKYLFELSNLYMYTGNYKFAYETLKKLNEIAPNKSEVLKNLIKCSKILNLNAETKEYSSTFREKFPEENLENEKNISEENMTVKNPIKTKNEETKNREKLENQMSPTNNSQEENKPPQKIEQKFLSVLVNSQAVAIPGKKCSTEITIGSQNFHISCSNLLKIENLKAGTLPYSITVRYYNLATGELEETYSGSGFVEIRYNNQNLYVKIIGKKVILE